METTLQPLKFVAGPLTVRFEPATGMLRYVRLGEAEVLRGVYVAVRDRNWDTVAPVVADLSVDREGDSFAIAFNVDCVREEIDFGWRGEIIGKHDGTIEYRMSGEARSAFLRNRIGFCVLHPIRECAGRPCLVRDLEGLMTKGMFPREISPHQPFKRVGAIRHAVSDTVEAEVTLAGDVFEMEDQRNWTDASFKTYCTPLELPFPVQVRPGERVEQSVALSLVERERGAARALGGSGMRRTELPPVAFDDRRLPPLGLCVASHRQMPSECELERLASLNLSHLRVDVRAGDADSLGGLEAAARQAAALGIPLDVAVTLSDAADEELTWLARALKGLQPKVGQFLIFQENEKSTSATWIELARHRLGMISGGAKFAGGTNAYFAELNRGRPEPAAVDAVVYSITPQVHASDDASLVETLEAQGDTVRSAGRFCGGKPICVGPITLRPRFNPNATAAVPPPQPGELPPEVDPRQCRLFTAAWTLGSICELAATGAARLTYFETTGWRGVMETQAPPPLPLPLLEKFPSIAGGVYPVYHVLADVGEFAGAEIAPLDFARPLEVRGAVLRKALPGGTWRHRLLVADVSSSVQRVPLPPPAEFGGTSYRCRQMDETNIETAVREPEQFRQQSIVDVAETALELRPYAYACLDVVGAERP